MSFSSSCFRRLTETPASPSSKERRLTLVGNSLMLRPVLVLVMALWLAVTPQRQSVGASPWPAAYPTRRQEQAIAEASVWLHQTRGGYRTRTIKTEADGQFSFTGLAAGSFSIVADAETYLSATFRPGSADLLAKRR